MTRPAGPRQPWIRIACDALLSNEELLGLDDQLFRLWVTMLAWSRYRERDGDLPSRVVARYAHGIGIVSHEAAGAALVDAGLWTPSEEGWQIVGYALWQQTSAEIEQQRVDKARAGRESGAARRARRNGASEQAVEQVFPPSPAPHPQERGENSPPMVPPSGGDVDQVFATWLQSTERTSRTVLTPKRRRLIVAALKLFPLQDVLDAVQGWKQSSWHRGENPGAVTYNDLELLLRDAAKVERFRDLHRQAGHLIGVGEQQRSVRGSTDADVGRLLARSQERRQLGGPS